MSRSRVEIPGSLVLVTGAGSGIGRATALAFADAGARVLAVDIDREAAEKTAAACGERGVESVAYQVDVADRVAVARLADVVHAEHGPLDVLVNNAGVGMSGRFLDMPLEDWDWIVSINLMGAIHMCRAFGPEMVERGRGHVVNISSGLGYTPTATEPGYGTTKAAVLAFSRSLRADWHSHGVGVSAICPGVINTPIISHTRFRGEQGAPDRVARVKDLGLRAELVDEELLHKRVHDSNVSYFQAAHLNDEGKTLRPTLLQDMIGNLFPVASTKPLIRAWRTLLLGPALFRYDDAEAFAQLVAHADEVANELLDTFGWLLDVKRDYACIVRASGMSTGPVTSFTPFGTSDQMALLMCTAIREQVTGGAWPKPDSYGCLHVTTEDMNALFYTLRERYGENWGNEARSKSSRTLLNDIYRKMRQVGLLRGPDGAGNVLILPTAARYSVTYEKAGQESKATSKQKIKSMAAALPGMDEAE